MSATSQDFPNYIKPYLRDKELTWFHRLVDTLAWQNTMHQQCDY